MTGGSGSGSYSANIDMTTGEISLDSSPTGVNLDEVMGSEQTIGYGLRIETNNTTGDITIRVFDVDGTTLRREVTFNMYRVMQGYGVPTEAELEDIFTFTNWTPGTGGFFSYSVSGSTYTFRFGSSLTDYMEFTITTGTAYVYGEDGRPSLPLIAGSPAVASLPATGGVYIEMSLVNDTDDGITVYFRYDAATETMYYYDGSTETTFATLAQMSATGGFSSGNYQIYYNTSNTDMRIIVYSDSVQTAVARDFTFNMYTALTSVVASGDLSGFLRRYAIRDSSDVEYSNGAFGSYSSTAGTLTRLDSGSFPYEYQFIYQASTTAPTPTDHEIRMSVKTMDAGTTPPVPGVGAVHLLFQAFEDTNNGATIFMAFDMPTGVLTIREGSGSDGTVTYEQLSIDGGYTHDSMVISYNPGTTQVTIDVYSGSTTTIPNISSGTSIVTRRVIFNLNSLINSPTDLTTSGDFNSQFTFPVYLDMDGNSPYSPTWYNISGAGAFTFSTVTYPYDYRATYADQTLETPNGQVLRVSVKRGQTYQPGTSTPAVPPPAPVPAVADSSAIAPIAAVPIVPLSSIIYSPPETIQDMMAIFRDKMLNGVDPNTTEGAKIASIANAIFPLFAQSMKAFLNGEKAGGNVNHPLVGMKVVVK
jgi:hypothetical protein